MNFKKKKELTSKTFNVIRIQMGIVMRISTRKQRADVQDVFSKNRKVLPRAYEYLEPSNYLCGLHGCCNIWKVELNCKIRGAGWNDLHEMQIQEPKGGFHYRVQI